MKGDMAVIELGKDWWKQEREPLSTKKAVAVVEKPKRRGLSKLLTIRQVAEHSGYSEAQVRKWCRDRDLPACKPMNGQYRVREDDLADFLSKFVCAS